MSIEWRPELNALTTSPSFFGTKLLTVDDSAALLTKIREEYTGRMVDIPDVSNAEPERRKV